ncbi:DNA repair protein RecN [Tessaracoccus sp. SD287]|uniref:DNA repair protein RecN n=1 Tax=Tessaracoccus sp. SD287 TaxID=2782008 RepID=UPI001A96CD95|nr:DNA repair protein RecN [Tessaracoccus sp. SD287]
MLRELRIQNLGVIADATLSLGPGMTALTGETGAGKTMVTSGLGLLLGERADSGVVRHGSDRALVEGRFDDVDEQAVEDRGGALDDGELLASRQISAAGRSRAFVGGAQTTLAGLSAVTTELATIHGQSGQVRLASTERQRDVLDRACGPEHLARVADHRRLHDQRRAVLAELDELTTRAQERAREAGLLRLGLDEIAAVDPHPGEDQALATEAARLTSLDELQTLSQEASMLLSGSEDPASDDVGAVGLVGRARRAVDSLAGLDPTAAELLVRATEMGHQLNDLAADIASYRADLDADPARLDQVLQRQSEVSGLTRKYGSTITEVLAWAAQSAVRLDELEGSDERIEQLRTQVVDLTARLDASAAQITAARKAGAQHLSDAVHAELAALAMRHARIQFALVPTDEVGPHGAEAVQLLFAANAGSPPAPLGKVASGGELSRVRLALEVVLAGEGQGHTFVFDEVDAGIGGAVALEVGRRLARLAEHAQVLVVTHLAQVAAFADAQFVVLKQSDGEVTSSGVAEVTGAAREAELARMMGGMEHTTSAQEHARELLATALEARQPRSAHSSMVARS